MSTGEKLPIIKSSFNFDDIAGEIERLFWRAEIQELEITIQATGRTYFLPIESLCLKSHYFEKMFSGHFAESKVTLDLAPIGFHNTVIYLYSGVLELDMQNVLQTCECAEYLMIDTLKYQCEEYFNSNFSNEHWPVILQALSEMKRYPTLLTPEITENFIKKYFLKIAKTKKFLDFPFATIEYFLSLDLMVDSYGQVEDAINGWITARKDITPEQIDELRAALFVKQCNKYLVTRPAGKILAYSKYIYSSVAVFEVDDGLISLIILKQPKNFIPCGQFKEDASITRSLLIEDHFTDIFLDYESHCLRVNWTNRTFTWLDIFTTEDSYFPKLCRYKMLDGYSFDSQTNEKEYSKYIAFSILTNPTLYLQQDFPHFVKKMEDQFGDGGEKLGIHFIKNRAYISKLDKEIIQVDIANLSSIQSVASPSSISHVWTHDMQLFVNENKLHLCQKASKKIYMLDNHHNWSLSYDLFSDGLLLGVSSHPVLCKPLPITKWFDSSVSTSLPCSNAHINSVLPIESK